MLAALLLQVSSRGGGLRVLRTERGLFPEEATFWGTKAGLLCGHEGPPSPASRRQPGPGPQWRTWVHTAGCLGRFLTAPEGTVPGPTLILTTCLQLMLGLYRASGTLPGVSLPLPRTPPPLRGSHAAVPTARLPDSNSLGAETALPSFLLHREARQTGQGLDGRTELGGEKFEVGWEDCAPTTQLSRLQGAGRTGPVPGSRSAPPTRGPGSALSPSTRRAARGPLSVYGEKRSYTDQSLGHDTVTHK